MTKLSLLPVLLLGCAKPPAPSAVQDGPTLRKLEALGALMKNDINPAFSKLVFLIAHADTEDPKAVRTELTIAGTNLRTAIGKLRAWHEIPTESTQGREVFLTYAASIDTMTDKLIDSIGRDDRPKALVQLEEIADTCNNCHHFFRLKVEDSVVMRTDGAGSGDIVR
ncbi:MAG: hypothetical protein KF773_31195 [Deltaproteobacteria bacterium]|nr:hypothetical protein [Deltaproteobacteria bacterium]MCW5805510.1 hypothetical protein [Deltaproteobacteria bacterium]